MQYHYVVFYDSDKKQWHMEFDPEAYFPDGNVWDDARADEHGYGWFYPGDDTPIEAELDQTLTNTLYSIVDIFPIPGEDEEDGWKRRTRSPIGSIYADLVKEQSNADV